MTNTKILFYNSVCLSWKNLGQNLSSTSTLKYFNLQETGYQVGSWEKLENSEIVAISNQYKDTLDDFIDSLDLESPDQSGPIDERSYNALISEGNLADLLERIYLDKNLLDRSSWLAFKTGDSQIPQNRDVAPQAGYGKSQRGGEDCQKNKINPVIKENSSTEISVYHHEIDQHQ